MSARLATEGIHETVLRMVGEASGNCLDIGAGHGDLISRLRARWPALKCFACDFHTDMFELEDVEVKAVNLDTEPLPYPDEQFDLVTMTEVVEHVENPRALMREIARVLRPGGRLVMSTPNILNMVSRVRYFGFGFANLFGPLPMDYRESYSVGAHISPVSYFYLAHGLYRAGFRKIEVGTDKEQRRSRLLYYLLYLPLKLVHRAYMKQELFKSRTVDDDNRVFVEQQNSRALLLGRTVIVKAAKA